MMMIADLSVWTVLGWTIALGVVWGIGTAFLVSRALLKVQRIIAQEVKGYLSLTLEDHRHKATEQMGQDVQGQLISVQEELSTALANLVKAEDAQDIAETATQAKSDFLSRMSHEIRTPINGIIGSLGLIEPRELTVQQAEDLARARVSSNRLLKVINQVLDMAQIEADEVEYHHAPFDISDLCEEAIDNLQSMAGEKGLDLLLEINENIELRRLGDEQKIHQTLTNLLGNAIKFSQQGYVKLTVADGHDNSLSFSVEDTGIGISKREMETLFEPFSSGYRKGAGTGLGLSICKTFVNGMGGDISAASQEGVGSTFTFCLPLPFSDQEEEEGRVRVLSVDDDSVNRKVLQRYLESLGCSVDEAENGQIAVSKFRANNYDLIFMDLLMPVLDGFMATRAIRKIEAEEGLHPTEIVALTASVVGSVKEDCMAAGMDIFLAKPFHRSELETIVEGVRDDF